MSIRKTLGGDRLGSGNKMKVDLHGFERSTFDLGYLWRSTMAPGTLVPFMVEVALPGDTFDIDLQTVIMTHPTIGPLFGSYKVQLDVFQAPIRLYQAQLHNNQLGIGLAMQNVKLPQIRLTAPSYDPATPDQDNSQINPSSLISYLGIRGVGHNSGATTTRDFNAVPLLAYWDIYKNYYANKQEKIGFAFNTQFAGLTQTVTSVKIDGSPINKDTSTGTVPAKVGSTIDIAFTGAQPNLTQIYLQTLEHGTIAASDGFGSYTVSAGVIHGTFFFQRYGQTTFQYWRYQSNSELNQDVPVPKSFDLAEIDNMRAAILASGSTPFIVNNSDRPPYNFSYGLSNGKPNNLSNLQGLGLKTYQSDIAK